MNPQSQPLVDAHGAAPEGSWRTAVFSLDHKLIGIQYAITALVFLLIGFVLMTLMRWQLAHPGQPVPLFGPLLGQNNAPGGIIAPDFYNGLGAMHGTIMIFLGVVPLAVGGFGNYLLPLQIGASDMAYPRLNMASYWIYLCAGVLMLASFVMPGGPAQSGWTSYPPLTIFASSGQTIWLLGMLLIITSSLFGSINFIVTIVQLRAPGLTFMRLPFFVWSQLVTSFLLLLAFPPLEAAAVFQLMDRLVGTSFFLPSGLVVSGQVLQRSRGRQSAAVAAPVLVPGPSGGVCLDPPGDGDRRRDHREQHPPAAVWLQGAGPVDAVCRIPVLHRVGPPHVHHRHGHDDEHVLPDHDDPDLDPLGGDPDLPVPVAVGGVDPVHDADAVRARVPADVRPGRTDRSAARDGPVGHPPARHLLRDRPLPLHRGARHLFALFAGIYHWFPKATGRRMNDLLGRIHFAGTFVCMNLIFMPMFVQGLAGMNRRLYDGGAQYAMNQDVLPLHLLIS